MARTPIIAGNWKMNNTVAAGVVLARELVPLVKDAKATVVVCPTATALAGVTEAVKGSNIAVGAQNVHWEKSGAYTGEISTDMLTELGVSYCVLGHSERRDYFGETNEGVNKRAHAAYAAGITPIICCGESLEIREAGTYLAYVAYQIEAALAERGTENAATIAALADGSLGRAYTLAEEGLSLRDAALELLTRIDALSIEEIRAHADALGARTHEERTAWLSYVQMGLRDLLILHEDGAAARLYHTDRRESLTALLMRMTSDDIFTLMDGTRELTRRFAANVNPALQMEAFLLRARRQFA